MKKKSSLLKNFKKKENSISNITSFGYNKDKGTVFEIAFRYEVAEQIKIFQMIEYLGQQLHYEKL